MDSNTQRKGRGNGAADPLSHPDAIIAAAPVRYAGLREGAEKTWNYLWKFCSFRPASGIWIAKANIVGWVGCDSRCLERYLAALDSADRQEDRNGKISRGAGFITIRDRTTRRGWIMFDIHDPTAIGRGLKVTRLVTDPQLFFREIMDGEDSADRAHDPPVTISFGGSGVRSAEESADRAHDPPIEKNAQLERPLSLAPASPPAARDSLRAGAMVPIEKRNSLEPITHRQPDSMAMGAAPVRDIVVDLARGFDPAKTRGAQDAHKAELTERIRLIVDDPHTDLSIFRRAAEVVATGRLPERELQEILQAIVRKRSNGSLESAGKYFLSRIREKCSRYGIDSLNANRRRT